MAIPKLMTPESVRQGLAGEKAANFPGLSVYIPKAALMMLR